MSRLDFVASSFRRLSLWRSKSLADGFYAVGLQPDLRRSRSRIMIASRRTSFLLLHRSQAPFIMAYYLGIDIGTSGTKTLLVDATGEVLAEASATYPMQQPRPGWTQQDPEDWWRATVKTVRAAVKKSGVPPSEVRGIGLSGQMHGSVFLDKNHDVIRPALLWNDQRTAQQCDDIHSAVGGRKKLIQMVANPALTGFQAPKILWLRDNEKRNFGRLNKVLLPKDDIRRRLTGELVSEVSDASGTLLLDVAKRTWSKRLLSKLDLDIDLLPPVVESHEQTGRLTAAVAKKLGLTTDCFVVGGAGDCAAGAVGNGVVKSGVLSTSIGTSGVMFVHSDSPQYDADGRLHTFCHAVDGKWHMMGGQLDIRRVAAVVGRFGLERFDGHPRPANDLMPRRRRRRRRRRAAARSCSCRTSMASGRRTPIHQREVCSPVWGWARPEPK